MSKNFIALCVVLCFVLVSLGADQRQIEQIVVYVNGPRLEPRGIGGDAMATEDPDELTRAIERSMKRHSEYQVISLSVDTRSNGGGLYYHGAWVVYQKR